VAALSTGLDGKFLVALAGVRPASFGSSSAASRTAPNLQLCTEFPLQCAILTTQLPTRLHGRNAIKALILSDFIRCGRASGLLAGPRLLATPASHVLPITNPHEVGDGALVQGWGKRLKTRKLKRWEYCVKALSV
jgi:hypothetical protein